MKNETPRQLPIVAGDGQRWYVDARLLQLRNVDNPHDYHDLSETEMALLLERLE
jgi:hypothetical protein